MINKILRGWVEVIWRIWIFSWRWAALQKFEARTSWCGDHDDEGVCGWVCVRLQYFTCSQVTLLSKKGITAIIIENATAVDQSKVVLLAWKVVCCKTNSCLHAVCLCTATACCKICEMCEDDEFIPIGWFISCLPPFNRVKQYVSSTRGRTESYKFVFQRWLVIYALAFTISYHQRNGCDI